jgi:formamidopyrimidine-DNA glycosylase
MPELPEVETVRRGLEPALSGARLARVEQRRKDLRFVLPERFVDRLTGARVLRLDRRAKYLILPLDTGESLIAHLGMTGRFTVEDKRPGAFHHVGGADPKHDHVVFETETGARVVYNDPRRFGFMDLVATDGLETCRHFAGMGPEPLGNGFHAEGLGARLAGRRQPIKTLLLDQRIVAGLGNIYVCEALFRARIAPEREAGSVTPAELDRLVVAVRAVLEEALEAGGSTLRDFRASDGALGYFQHRFAVYDRENEPCLAPGCDGLIGRKVQAGRSSFFCPTCQV